MSYILDALKKAEKDRGLAEVPTLETVHDLPAKKKTGAWIAAGCGALCLIAAAWLFFSASSERIEPEAPVSIVINQVAETPEIEDSKPLHENRAAIVQSSSMPVSGGIAMNPSAPETAKSPAAAQPEAKPQAAAVKPESSGTNEPEAKPRIAVTEPESHSPKEPETKPSVTVTADGTTRKSPQISRNLPSLREIAATMKISVHIYSDDPDERLVFIDGTKYREGAHMKQDCVLEEITPEGAVLRRGEETFTLR